MWFFMGDFSEKTKQMVREKAHFRCCRCQHVSIEVHHIIPQEHHGKDDFDNAAPLCANCHTDFGDNPEKRKEIRQMRDWWYKICEEMYKNVIVLKEKPEPKPLTKEFPAVFFLHKEKGYLYLSWPNEFVQYYLFAAEALQHLAKIDPETYKKVADPDFAFRQHIYVELIERLVFNWLSYDYHSSWLLKRKKTRFPWMSEVSFSPIDTAGIASETVNYLGNEEFRKNIFSEASIGFSSFVVPKGTTVTVSRDDKTKIIMENDFYKIQFGISVAGWLYMMRVPEWLSGLSEQQQKEFATITFNLSFHGEPNAKKLTDDKIGFYQKWAEDLCQEFRENFDWLTTLNRIKDWQVFEIRNILESLRTETFR